MINFEDFISALHTTSVPTVRIGKDDKDYILPDISSINPKAVRMFELALADVCNCAREWSMVIPDDMTKEEVNEISEILLSMGKFQVQYGKNKDGYLSRAFIKSVVRDDDAISIHFEEEFVAVARIAALSKSLSSGGIDLFELAFVYLNSALEEN